MDEVVDELCASVAAVLFGDVVAVVERVRDDRCGHLEHKFAECGVLGVAEVGVGVAEQDHQRVLVNVLARLTAREEPAVVPVGCGVQVRQVLQVRADEGSPFASAVTILALTKPVRVHPSGLTKGSRIRGRIRIQWG